MLEVKITPIFNTVGVVFQQWAYDRLNGTLGTFPGSEHSQSGQQIQRAGGPPDNSGATVTALQSVAGVLQQMQQQWSGGGAGGVATATTNTPTLSKKDMFNDWQVAAIKGWSCVKETTRIQRFWQTVQGVKQDQIIRTRGRSGRVSRSRPGCICQKTLLSASEKLPRAPESPSQLLQMLIKELAHWHVARGGLMKSSWSKRRSERRRQRLLHERTTNKCRWQLGRVRIPHPPSWNCG
jgi:hypothetical protein